MKYRGMRYNFYSPCITFSHEVLEEIQLEINVGCYRVAGAAPKLPPATRLERSLVHPDKSLIG